MIEITIKHEFWSVTFVGDSPMFREFLEKLYPTVSGS